MVVFHRRLSSWVSVVLLDLQFLQGPIPQFLQGPVCVVVVAITSHSSWANASLRGLYSLTPYILERPFFSPGSLSMAHLGLPVTGCSGTCHRDVPTVARPKGPLSQWPLAQLLRSLTNLEGFSPTSPTPITGVRAAFHSFLQTPVVGGHSHNSARVTGKDYGSCTDFQTRPRGFHLVVKAVSKV